MTAPLVTAIVPTYRRADLVTRALESVIKQTYRPLELIAVDDGSGDETPEVLAAFEERAKEAGVEYRWFTKDNGGVSLARNHGMEHARGEYFAFLDDDDEWLPPKVERQVALMQEHPEAGLSFTRYFHANKRDTPKPKLDYLKEGWVFAETCDGTSRAHLQTIMITREAFEITGGFSDIRCWEDSEFALRLALERPFKALLEPLTIIHPQQVSLSRSEGIEGDLRRGLEKLQVIDRLEQNYKDHPRYVADAVRRMRARYQAYNVKCLTWLGRLAEARKMWDQAWADNGPHDELTKARRKLRKARLYALVGKKVRAPK
jgi:glycosyltransferase involved in cell wall biosynthesis